MSGQDIAAIDGAGWPDPAAVRKVRCRVGDGDAFPGDHEVTERFVGVSSACRSTNFMITNVGRVVHVGCGAGSGCRARGGVGR